MGGSDHVDSPNQEEVSLQLGFSLPSKLSAALVQAKLAPDIDKEIACTLQEQKKQNIVLKPL
jgi:hypothetical protein